MKESTTYQAILREGREEGLAEGLAEGREEGLAVGRVAEARAILLRLGARRFGAPSEEARVALESITAIERLEALTERLLDVESWDELLAAQAEGRAVRLTLDVGVGAAAIPDLANR